LSPKDSFTLQVRCYLSAQALLFVFVFVFVS
jgi:hypothetical protein